MSVKEFANVVVRFFGLWLLFQCIGMIEQTISAILFPFVKDNPDYQRFVTIASIFNVILYVVLGIALVWKPQIVTERIPYQETKETRIRVTTTSLMFLCFSVSGLVFLVDGLKTLLYYVTARAFNPEGPTYFGSYGQRGILPAVFETTVGLWLLFRFKQIVRSLHRMWRAGKTLGTRKSEGEE